MTPKCPQSTCPCSPGAVSKRTQASGGRSGRRSWTNSRTWLSAASVAVCQDFPVELASVQHSLGHTLLQIGNIRINFACLWLARLLGRQDLGRLHGLTDRFAVSSGAPGYLANGYPFPIQVSNHESLLKC